MEREQRIKEFDLIILFKSDNLENQEINILRAEVGVCGVTVGDELSYKQKVIGIFHSPNPFGHKMALRSTQTLTEMNSKDISWGGKGGRCLGLKTLCPSCAEFIEILEVSSY